MKAPSTQLGTSRWYECPRCGKSHPSVTSLLDVIGSKALMGWMAKNGTTKLKLYSDVLDELVFIESPRGIELRDRAIRLAEERWRLKENTPFWKSGKEAGEQAADYGTQAHSWIEAHLRGADTPLELLPEPVQNSVKGMLAWEKDHKFEVIKTEQTFYNCELNYAGTADVVGNLDLELSVGDWKTSTGIFFNYVIQGWLYALADEMQNADRLYRQIFIGRFGKDGSSDVKIFKRGEFPTIETARKIVIGCGAIFAAQQEWDKKFPYRKPAKTTLIGGAKS